MPVDNIGIVNYLRMPTNLLTSLPKLPTGTAVPSSSSGLAKPVGSAVNSATKTSAGIIPALIMAGASLISSIIGASSARKSRKWQEALLDKQRQQALEDRAHDEEYNSPTAQLMRLKLAGLSPNSLHDVATTDSSGMNVKGSPDAVAAAQALELQSMQNGVSDAFQAIGLQKQRAEVHKIYSDIASNSSSTRVKSLEADFLKATFSNRVAEQNFKTLAAQLELPRLEASINQMLASTDLTKEERKLRGLSYNLAIDTYDDTVRLAKFKADNAELDNKIKDYDLNKVMPAKLQQVYEQISHIRQSTYISYEQFVAYRDNLEKSGYVLDEQARSLRFNNDAMQKTFDEYVENLRNEYHLTETESKFAATQQVMKLVNQAAVTLAASGAAVFSAKKSMMKPNSKVPSAPSYGGYDPYQMVFD